MESAADGVVRQRKAGSFRERFGKYESKRNCT